MKPAPYWPWWLTALSLGATTVAFWLLVRRPFGVSGIVARFSNLAEERAKERGERGAPTSGDAWEAAMLAATLEAFGASAVSAAQQQAAPAPRPSRRGRTLGPELTLATHALFLAAIAAGGLLSQLHRGGWSLQGMGDAFARVAGSGSAQVVALAAGGILVGFGARLCGGCTAGHGLTGCARLQPGSLAATAAFLGGGAVVSILMHGGLG